MDESSNDDGNNWCAATLTWSDSSSDHGSPGAENEACWPVAVATYDSSSSLYSCESLQLDGSGSFDPDGLTVTWSWELNSAPAASELTTSDIEEPDDMNPVFVPDVAGTYVFTLTVYNGSEYSPPTSLSVTIAERTWNTSPVSDPGSDQEYDENSMCQAISYGASYECDDCIEYDFDLDGSASSDPDGDYLNTPSWTITYDPESAATIDDEDTWTPTVTIAGPSATYGSATTTEVEVTLEVSDCMGATSSESVYLYYNCTGS